MVPWNSAKAKVQLRLGVQRLRTLQEKKLAQAKASRRDIAMLLEKGRLETARIKTENIINEDIYVELLELLELYCELLIARFGLLDQSTREPDPGVSEGVCAIIFAAPRTELKELHVLRDILMHKFGREYSQAVIENRDHCVSERVVRKLDVATPAPVLVDAYLAEIAKGYGVPWSPPTPPAPDGPNDDDGAEGGVKEPAADPEDEKGAAAARGDAKVPDAAAISAEARSAGVRTPKLPEVPPTESGRFAAADGAAAKDKAQDKEKEKEAAKSAAPPPPPPAADAPKKKNAEEDEFEALAKRFEALKKR